MIKNMILTFGLSTAFFSSSFGAGKTENTSAKFSCSLYAWNATTPDTQISMNFKEENIGGTVFQIYSADLSRFGGSVQSVEVQMNTFGKGSFWVLTNSGRIAADITNEHKETWAYLPGFETGFKMYCNTK